jgi:hypothetical protein
MNKETSQTRTAATLGTMFGTRAPQVLKDVSRNKPIITRKNKHGAAIQMLTFNEAKALLTTQGKVFDSNAELEKALWHGMKMKDGGLLRDSFSSGNGLPTRYAD